VLTHEDDNLRNERYAAFDRTKKREFQASNASWNAQTGLAKPTNAGAVNAYSMRQRELESQVLEKTDYSQYRPMHKKQMDQDNYGHKPDGPPRGITGKKPDAGLLAGGSNWLNTTEKSRQVNKDFEGYSQQKQSMKQDQLRSALDNHGFGNT